MTVDDLATQIMALDWKARRDWTVDEQADRYGELQEMLTAYLSARSAEPVAWRLLRNGEVIEAADQVLADDTVTWLPLRGWEIGRPYYPGLFVPVRRAHPTPEGSDV